MASHVSREIHHLAVAPNDPVAFREWIGLRDAFAFLEQDAKSEWFTIYLSNVCAFMNTILVASTKVANPDWEDLMQWNFNAYDSWGVVHSSHSNRLWISTPLEDTGSQSMQGGEQLVYARDFEGRTGGRSYIEILQKFTHVLDLHFVDERKAYCRLDGNGDIEDFIRILKYEERKDGFDATAVEIRRTILDHYAALADMTLVRMFDFTRMDVDNFSAWTSPISTEIHSLGNVHYLSHCEPTSDASFARGVQIAGLMKSRQDILHDTHPLKEAEREYAPFVAWDFRNRRIATISTKPDATTNYFVVSNLPFETSPVFFKPEVLSKYKANTEKYRVSDRTITCRGAWSLQTYDINEAGQVHTYVVYLRSLPYNEQLYWKSFNEPPKAGISERAWKSDFEASWDFDIDPLQSLKGRLAELHQLRIPWWRLRSDTLADRVHYPVTDSTDEWLVEILALDQFVVEGFDEAWWKQRAVLLGYSPKNDDRSLNFIQECLVRSGVPNGPELVEPFRDVHRLRQLKGHIASGERLAKARQSALSAHGTFKKHFEDLCRKCDQSLETIKTIADRQA